MPPTTDSRRSRLAVRLLPSTCPVSLCAVRESAHPQLDNLIGKCRKPGLWVWGLGRITTYGLRVFLSLAIFPQRLRSFLPWWRSVVKSVDRAPVSIVPYSVSNGNYRRFESCQGGQLTWMSGRANRRGRSRKKANPGDVTAPVPRPLHPLSNE